MRVFPTTSRSGVYMIRCQYTKKAYIGSSVNIAERWRTHRKALERGDHHSPALQNAWNKYGSAAFEAFVIAACPPERLRDEEQFWLREHSSRLNGTRDVTGGRRRTGATVLTRGKQSVASKALWASSEFRGKTVARMRGAKRRCQIAIAAEHLGVSQQLLRYHVKRNLIHV